MVKAFQQLGKEDQGILSSLTPKHGTQLAMTETRTHNLNGKLAHD